jgi:cell division protein YceG involved in septum cleavage
MTYINKVLALKILILIFFILSLSFFSYLNYSLNKKIYNNSKNRKIFLINEGDSITKSINTLKKKNIISSDFRSKIIIYMYRFKP